MKKIISACLTAVVVLSTSFSFGITSSANSIQGNKGMTLDCARSFYSPRLIRKYIDTLSKNHAEFMLLHLTDNERFGVENSYLGQTTKKAKVKNGIYFNRKTHKAFLSKAQLKSLIKYAQKRHIELIPEVDLPGHDKGILKLLSYTKSGRRLKKQLVYRDGYNEFKLSKKGTLTLSKRILSEYLPLLPKGNHIGMGADEISLDNKTEENNFVKYINSIDSFVNKKGYKLTAWNDSFHKRTINRYRKNITVFYWSQNGQQSDPDDRKELIRLRATLPQLVHHGFKVINCNFYYLYVINFPKMYTAPSRFHWKELLDKWNERVWDDNNTSDIYKGNQKIDSALCIWSEPHEKYSSAKIYQLSHEYLNEFLQHQD
ncbi:family 20 glycosylhydrolase [Apilactobacillus kunkeei]|uniref:family 20 glycosylhydrolase n=1 Tax=Apilactobacillus kunkeei TaxID=148814 RepID=UPI0039E06250